MQKEYFLQVAVVNYVQYIYPNVLFCASAGGMRTNIGTAVKMKRMGYKKGFPDLFFYEPRKKYLGLAIELKTDKGIISPEQRDWNKCLNSRGYKAVICFGDKEAIKVIDEYFSL